LVDLGSLVDFGQPNPGWRCEVPDALAGEDSVAKFPTLSRVKILFAKFPTLSRVKILFAKFPMLSRVKILFAKFPTLLRVKVLRNKGRPDLILGILVSQTLADAVKFPTFLRVKILLRSSRRSRG
jgi:hypothetical protein